MNYNNINLKALIFGHLFLLQILGTLSIRGGTPERIENVPFVVQIFEKNDFICAGALVAQNIVVTAGHCMEQKDASSLIVKAGASTLKETGIKVGVADCIRPKTFSEFTLHKDVAVLTLITPIKYPQTKLARLCNHQWKAGDPVEVYGWSVNGKIQLKNQLHVAQLNVVEGTFHKHLNGNTVGLTDSMFSAFARGKGISFGDDGGPVIINGEFCGVISFSFPRLSGDYQDVYTNVNKVRRFIEEHMPSGKNQLKP